MNRKQYIIIALVFLLSALVFLSVIYDEEKQESKKDLPVYRPPVEPTHTPVYRPPVAPSTTTAHTEVITND